MYDKSVIFINLREFLKGCQCPWLHKKCGYLKKKKSHEIETGNREGMDREKNMLNYGDPLGEGPIIYEISNRQPPITNDPSRPAPT